jgi:hypothetical protein
VVILAGELEALDGSVSEHLVTATPCQVVTSPAQDDEYLVVDLGQSETVTHHSDQGALGYEVGLFRGQLIVTDDPAALEGPAEELDSYYKPALGPNQRPPNGIRDVQIRFTPNVALTALEITPWGEEVCEREMSGLVADAAPPGAMVTLGVTVDGFPAGDPVRLALAVRLLTGAPEEVAQWSYVSPSSFAEGPAFTFYRTLGEPAVVPTARMPSYILPNLPAGQDLSAVRFEVDAFVRSDETVRSRTASHVLYVARPGAEVVVHQSELCPPHDVLCRRARDRGGAHNLVARRAHHESQADLRQLFDPVQRPLSRCAGAPTSGSGATGDCAVYREYEDPQLPLQAGRELDFELAINGQRLGQGSWLGDVAHVTAAHVEDLFRGVFGLTHPLSTSFLRSSAWNERALLDVVYDPHTTHVQWWRLAWPSLHFLELAQFGVCGERRGSVELVLADLTDSEIRLACQRAPGIEALCVDITPTPAAQELCAGLVIDGEGARGQACLARW